MKPADDALIIDTSTLSVQEVITELTTIIKTSIFSTSLRHRPLSQLY